MTTDCTRFAPMLGSRDGELSPTEQAALSAHLESCPTCQALAADAQATDGLLSDALSRAAAARDFSTFADEVMARVARAERPGLWGWVRRHRAATAASLVPVVAALAVIVYVRVEGGPGPVAMLELSSEGAATTVLQTADGPVVLLQEESDT